MQEITKPEIPGINKPTTLPLFRVNSYEAARLRSGINQVDRVISYQDRIIVALNSRRSSVAKRISRLIETDREVRSEFEGLMSSWACSEAYLALLSVKEEFSLSDPDFIDFFKYCLRTNTRLSSVALQSADRPNAVDMIKRDVLTGKTMTSITDVIADRYSSIPEWFTGTENEWKIRMLNWPIFFNLLGRNIHSIPIDKSPWPLGQTIKGGTPDWLETLDEGKLPDRAEVETEKEEDRKAAEKAVITRNHLRDQMRYSYQEYATKYESSWRAFGVLAGEYQQSNTFHEFILKLPLVRSGTYVNNRPFDGKTQISSTDKATEEETGAFFERVGFSSKELVALWIEDCLVKNKIAPKMDAPIDSQLAVKFQLLFETSQHPEKIAQLRALRETDKKAFNTLNFDISPLLKALSQNETDYLLELINLPSQTVGEMVMELAEAISTHGQELASNPELGNLVRKIRNHSVNFTKNNWEFLFNLAFDAAMQDDEDPDEDGTQEQVEQAEEVEQIEEEAEAIRVETDAGNLTGWNLFYTLDRSLDERNMEQIPGATLEELETSLDRFIGTHDIPCNIKTGSVIRTLDWQVTVPDEVERKRMTKTIGGVDFKRRQRGDVRIFYIINREQNKIIFFLHQKKAFSYGF